MKEHWIVRDRNGYPVAPDGGGHRLLRVFSTKARAQAWLDEQVRQNNWDAEAHTIASLGVPSEAFDEALRLALGRAIPYFALDPEGERGEITPIHDYLASAGRQTS